MINEKGTEEIEFNKDDPIPQGPLNRRQSIDGIIEKEDYIEHIKFHHNYFNVGIVKSITINKQYDIFDFLIHNDFANPLILDESEISSLKTEQLLQMLKPKIEQYLIKKDVSLKSTFMKNLSIYAEFIGYEATLGYLIPLVSSLLIEKNEVIIGFLTGMDKLIKYLLNNGGYNIIMQKIVPIIIEILKTRKGGDIVKQAYKSLILLTELAKVDDLAIYILPPLIIFAQDDKKVQLQLLAIKLFNDIAKIIGAIFLESYIIPQIGSFCENSNESIRMCIIQNIIQICQSVSYECFSTKIISCYKILSNDQNWEIRKAACEILPLFAKMSNATLRNDIMNIYIKYTEDPEEKIKLCCVGIFGEFISYYSEEVLEQNKNLLNCYINEILRYYENRTYDKDYASINKAAFSFPSVILMYKKEKWEILKPIYLKFVYDKSFKIKKTISKSFHEISKLIGEENSERDIAPIILDYFNTTGFEIKNSIINILPDYLKTIKNMKIKKSFLECFTTSFNQKKKWRDTYCFVKVLGQLKDVYDADIIYTQIVPLLVRTCLHTVAKVRIKSSKKISYLFMQILQQKANLADKVINIMISFATCAHYHYRQLFIYMSHSIMEHNEKLFINLFYENFLELAFDKIENVNITLSKVIAKKYKKVEWISKNEKMKRIIVILKNNKSEIVRNCLSEINIKESGINDNEICEKYKDINKKYINKLEIINNYFGIKAYCLDNDKWGNKNKSEK